MSITLSDAGRYSYILGSLSTTAEYLSELSDKESALETLRQGNSYFYPIWNTVEFFNTANKALKDLQQEDKFSGYVGCASAVQLATGTVLGLLSTHTTLVQGLSSTLGNMLSMGSLALTMYLNAGIALYKYISLGKDIQNLQENGSDEVRQAVSNRIHLRNPHLDQKPLGDLQMIAILKAEQGSQKKLAAVWTSCGFALSLVTAALSETCPIEIKLVTGGLLLVSMFVRAFHEGTEEKRTQERIEGIADGSIPVVDPLKGPMLVQYENQFQPAVRNTIHGYGSIMDFGKNRESSIINPY
jgi:hypothetical protein